MKKTTDLKKNITAAARKLGLVFLVLTLAVFSIGGTTGNKPDSQAAEYAARELYDLGLFKGTGIDGFGRPVFELDRPATRHEAVTMLVRLLGREDEALSRKWTVPFTDVADWAMPYVGYAYANGLTQGTSAVTFEGNQQVSAAQFLTFILRALGYTSGSDYEWDRAWELTDRLGITDGGYADSGEFSRGDAAVVSRNALSAKLKGRETTLYEAYHQDGDGQKSSGEYGFEVHYIDVGQGDAALIICDGHAMLVDGGTPDNSSLIYSYLKNLGIDHLDYIMCSHPHQDHVGGLAGALNYATVDVAYCPVREYDSPGFASFKKYLDLQGVAITVPNPGDTFAMGSATAAIYGPLHDSDDLNKESIVFKIRYGETSFLFTGDAKQENETEMIAAGYDLRCTVLKVCHHGSETSTSGQFLTYADPEYAVISVGKDNPYGHPAEGTLSRLRDADVKVYRTDECGTIICRSDGSSVSFTTEKGPKGPSSDDRGKGTEAGEIPEGTTYVLNTNTLVFHYPDCPSVSKMSEKNKLCFSGTREEVLAMHYRPCGVCKP